MGVFGIINYWAVLAAAVASFFFGWLWHGPLFGKLWLRLEGFEMPPVMTPEVKKQMAKSMSFGFLFQFIFAWGISYFVSALAFDVWSALELAAVVWLAFVVTTLAGGWLWEGRSLKLFLFNIIHPLLSTVIMTLIIALW